MYEIAIVNPRSIRKKGARKMAKKRRKAARRKTPTVARRKRRSTAGKRRPAMGYVVGKKRVRRRKLNPRHVARRSRRRHSNPRFSISGITSQLVPAVYGAGGALALDVALGYIPLPAVLQSGYGKHATRIVGALGIGWVASKFLRGKAAAIGQGALTVAVYGLLRDVAGQVLGGKVKGLAGDYEEVAVDGYLSPAAGVGAYLANEAGPGAMPMPGVGAYMQGDEEMY